MKAARRAPMTLLRLSLALPLLAALSFHSLGVGTGSLFAETAPPARPPIVLYDEPTAGLDPVTTSKIYDLLGADQAETGATVVAVSSDVEALAGFTETIGMLHEGRIRYQGPSATLRDASDPVVRQFVRGELEGPL